MKLFLIFLSIWVCLSSSQASSPNYISPLKLSNEGDFLHVQKAIQTSIYYRKSLIAKLEARLTIITSSGDDKFEDFEMQYSLDKYTEVSADSFRNAAKNGLSRSRAKIEFFINGDSYEIASLSEKHFNDELYFKRTLDRARLHFAELLRYSQTDS